MSYIPSKLGGLNPPAQKFSERPIDPQLDESQGRIEMQGALPHVVAELGLSTLNFRSDPVPVALQGVTIQDLVSPVFLRIQAMLTCS
jgi:hypothetical protein